jgi:hypothetical protein
VLEFLVFLSPVTYVCYFFHVITSECCNFAVGSCNLYSRHCVSLSYVLHMVLCTFCQHCIFFSSHLQARRRFQVSISAKGLQFLTGFHSFLHSFKAYTRVAFN